MKKWLYRLRRFLISVRVDMYPIHPSRSATAVMTFKYFNRFNVTGRTYYIAPENGSHLVGDLFELINQADTYQSHYPNNWHEMLQEYWEQQEQSEREGWE